MRQNTLEVNNPKKTTSATFLKGVLIYFLRFIARFELMKMKSDPSKPQTAPITSAAGRSSKEFSSSYSLPNFSVAWSESEKGASC